MGFHWNHVALLPCMNYTISCFDVPTYCMTGMSRQYLKRAWWHDCWGTLIGYFTYRIGWIFKSVKWNENISLNKYKIPSETILINNLSDETKVMHLNHADNIIYSIWFISQHLMDSTWWLSKEVEWTWISSHRHLCWLPIAS